MPPPLAALLCIIFIAYVFWTDRDRTHGRSNGLWVPFLWMFFAASRYPSEWLQLHGPGGAVGYREGNPVNAAVFFLLIFAGIYILSRRDIDWKRFLSGNKLFWLYLIYCLISILWSQYPLVSFKRWFKEFGNLVIVLVVLTEDDPYESLGAILRRLGFLWLPLSVLFIKYYPDLGRQYRSWDGAVMYTGVGTQKNGLGLMCLISTIYYAWHYLLDRKEDFRFWGKENVVDLVLIVMLAWLFHKSHSATSFACAVVAVALLVTARRMAENPGRVMIWAVAAISLYFILDTTTGLSTAIIHALGRKTNLTDRTQIWAIVESMAQNHFIGAGYQSFWLGPRLKTLWERIGSTITQAHNGYLEQYVELGYIGVVFTVAILLAGLRKARRLFDRNYAAGTMVFCLIAVAALYNYTEASFCAVNIMWFLTVFAVLEAPGSARWEWTGTDVYADLRASPPL